MAQSHALHNPHLAYLADQPRLAALAVVALRVAVTLDRWSVRARSRVALSHLDDHLLRDIGLDRHVAYRETRRTFWQG